MEVVKEKKSYLGQKGYTILKNELTKDEENLIRKELTIKPYIQGSPINNNNVVSFPAFRESENKFYLPRYFGEKNFGIPKKIKITEGENIDVNFNGSLRDYQEPVVKKYIDYVTSKQSAGGLLELFCAWGKTSASLYIISILKKKTIVLVHKEFLMNQWIERIKQFLPTARIGKIQGQVIDIENKDIVLAMIQSLAMKDYPSSIFESFGFTIIDEVHHISSEVFSNTLFKLVTKYMLGLSATMNRKDGTSNVFKMFLGNIIHKAKRDNEQEVIVRAINYYANDDEFNKIIVNFRGDPLYSSMITKLCEYNYRSEFILMVLSDMIVENPNQQIMILAHNKSLLKYLYDAIENRQIASVGYYIGGMKEANLKITETKKIVIATYSMASEALDIKTLTTLIMATPKTDIEQSVGRILREKHSNPVVVDIIDSHDMYQKQWLKRKAFYKKQNYKIIQTDNKNYTPNTNNWKIILKPKKSEEENDDEDDDDEKEINDKTLTGKCLIKFNKFN